MTAAIIAARSLFDADAVLVRRVEAVRNVVDPRHAGHRIAADRHQVAVEALIVAHGVARAVEVDPEDDPVTERAVGAEIAGSLLTADDILWIGERVVDEVRGHAARLDEPGRDVERRRGRM